MKLKELHYTVSADRKTWEKLTPKSMEDQLKDLLERYGFYNVSVMVVEKATIPEPDPSLVHWTTRGGSKGGDEL